MALVSLRTYEDWRRCIEVECGLTLAPDFIAARIAELSDVNNYKTRRFVETWGEPHRQQVVAWFQEAAQRIRQ
jgi:hypothetical protein